MLDRELAVVFDGSLEGFLCIVFAHYYDRINPLAIQKEGQYQNTLYSEEFFISTDFDKAARVQKGIRRKISMQAEHYVNYAFWSENESCYMDIFRYLQLGFKLGKSVDCYLQEDCVLAVHKLARYVGREVHLLSGFSRFAETKQGVFYCSIAPKNNVLPMLAEHFSDRMMNQAWVIHDKVRKQAAVYNGEHFVIGNVPGDVNLEYNDKELQVQELWRTFFNSVSIKERKNKKLQRNLLPLYFRKSMLEFIPPKKEK